MTSAAKLRWFLPFVALALVVSQLGLPLVASADELTDGGLTSSSEPSPEPSASPSEETTVTVDETVPVAPPSVVSDKEDYLPGQTVTLTGAGWQSTESVALVVNDHEGESWRHEATVEADETGGFTHNFSLPEWFVANYSVVATGELSGTVTTSFTDSIAGYRDGTPPAGSFAEVGFQPCTTVDNALGVGNDLYAVCTTSGSTIPKVSSNLVVSGFGLQSVVPSTATGIAFNVELELNDGGASPGRTVGVTASWDGGTTWGATPSNTTAINSAIDVTRTAPSSSPANCSRFGTHTWTYSEISDANFRLLVRHGNTTGVSPTVNIDRIRVRACWNELDIRQATVNGAATTNVAPSAVVSTFMQVEHTTSSTSGGTGVWACLSYQVEGAPSPTLVNFTPNFSSGGLNSRTFNITAPALAGSYDVTFRAYNNDACTTPAAVPLTLTDAIVVGVPTQLAFTTTAQTGDVFSCIGPISVQTQDVANAATNVLAATLVGLSSDGTGSFFSENTCAAALTVADRTIATGNNSFSFYYKATLRGDGTHELTASASGLTSAMQTQTIEKATPNFTFDLSTLGAKTFGGPDFSVASFAASTNSTGAITFALATGSVGCTVTSAGLVSITAVATGTDMCKIDASLATDANYDAAGPLMQSFNIEKATPNFTFDLSTLGAKTFGGADFSVASFASSTNSTGAITFALATGSVGCTVTSAGLVSMTGAATGTDMCKIDASLATDTNYDAAGPLMQSFNIAKKTLTVTPNPQNASRQYSDGNPSISPSYSGFAGTDDASDIDTPPTCSVAASATASAPASPPTHAITCSGGTDDNYTFSFNTGTLTITKEDATVMPWSTNAAALQVGSGGVIPAGSLSLKFDVREKTPDLPVATAAAGEINNTGMTLKLWPLTGGSALTLPCTSTINGIGLGYSGVKTFTCTNTGFSIPVNTYEVEAALACVVSGCYYGGTGWDAFTAYDPTLGFATGGGYVMMKTKNGPDEKMNFGFTMKYNKGGTNLQGNFIAVRHRADGTVSRLKSNSLGGLVIQQVGSCGVATFNGKSTYSTWDPTANGGLGAYVGTGNNSFSVYGEDCNNPGTGFDSLWMFGPGLINMSTPAGTVATDKIQLSGGNISVPHRLR